MTEKKTRFSIQILDTLTTALYENPISVFREYVQNSLDGPDGNNIGAKRRIKVDILIDRERKEIRIVDDGPGMDEEKFLEQMSSFGSKKKGSGGIGFRGIGRISAMPFCKELIFETMSEVTGKILQCTFSGEEYNKLLNNDPDEDLEIAMDSLLVFSNVHQQLIEGREHYFAVIIREYNEILRDVVGSTDRGDSKNKKTADEFAEDLSALLPIDYSPDFRSANKVKEKYIEVFGHSFDRYVCDVFLDGNQLFKKFKDNLIGKTGILFKRFAVPNPKKRDEMKVVALAWYSFNDFLTSKEWKDNDVEGFAIRSKNIAMGDKNSLGIHVINNVSSFSMTPRETLAAIAGFSGEFLFDTDLLQDDAKRDWFKPSPELSYLLEAISSFLRSARRCRYAMSEIINGDDNKSENARKRLMENLKNLMDESQYGEYVYDFDVRHDPPGKDGPEDGEEDGKISSFADFDIPK